MAKVFRTTSPDIQAIIGEAVRISTRLYRAFSSTRYPRDMVEIRNQISADIERAKRGGEKVKLTSSVQSADCEGLVYVTPTASIEILLNNQQWTVDIWAGNQATDVEKKELTQKYISRNPNVSEYNFRSPPLLKRGEKTRRCKLLNSPISNVLFAQRLPKR